MAYIKLSRNITEWGWYDDPVMLSLWIHILLSANWRDGEKHGVEVKRGSALTSVSKLATECGLTDKQVRLGLERLVKAGQITKEVSNKWTKIAVCKYDQYQCDEEDDGVVQEPTLFNPAPQRPEPGPEKDDKKEKLEAVERLYSLYPSSVVRIDGNRVSIKSKKDKDKLFRLLATHTEEQLATTIKQYLSENHGAYTKNFSTFLNNLPDYDATDQKQPADSSQQPATFYQSLEELEAARKKRKKQ